ncbi:DELTA-actitoxin-Aas1a-like isoform X2 [Lissotriton helveticus]
MDNRESAEAVILRLAADSGRCVLVEVTNNSGLSLESKRFYCESGRVAHPGNETIAPGGRDCTLFVKKSFTACGSVGVLILEYYEGKHRRRLAILFSNPFNHVLYKQMFAIHITDNLEATPKKLYNDMYYHRDRLQHYTKGEEYTIEMPHILKREKIKVTASMTTTCKSILKVLIEDNNKP